MRLLVSVGDPAGIGPAIALEAAQELASRARIVLFGDGARLLRSLNGPCLEEADPAAVGLSVVDVGPVADAVIDAHAPSAEGGRAQLAALDAAIDRALAGHGPVVTAPTSKEAVHLAGVDFIGQTEHLARRAGLADDAVTMMFLGPRLSVALATTHVAISRLPDVLRQAHVERATRHLVEALTALGVPRPRIVVGALNPHAGEGGAFGDEDRLVIVPAVAACAGSAADIEGPVGAETAFRRAANREVDGVVAMFHDQATIASKLLDWGAAVNVTWGLPFVRTSVDHGVAYDAAARGDASADGMRAAMELALRLAGRRA